MHLSVNHNALVAAVTQSGGLGNGGKLPWHPRRLSLDLQFLQWVTTNDYQLDDEGVKLVQSSSSLPNSIIMGRKTWESLPTKFRPLKGRKNLVVTRDQTYIAEGATTSGSLGEALSSCTEPSYVLGGASLYKEAIYSNLIDCAFITHLQEHPHFDSDVLFPMNSLEKFSKQINITKSAYILLKDSLRLDNEHYFKDSEDPVFVDGDVSYKIVAYI